MSLDPWDWISDLFRREKAKAGQPDEPTRPGPRNYVLFVVLLVLMIVLGRYCGL